MEATFRRMPLNGETFLLRTSGNEGPGDGGLGNVTDIYRHFNVAH